MAKAALPLDEKLRRVAAARRLIDHALERQPDCKVSEFGQCAGHLGQVPNAPQIGQCREQRDALF